MTADLSAQVNQLNAATKLKQLIADNNGIYGAILSSIDGHALVTEVADTIDGSRMSAMTSSCFSLGEKIASEAHQNGCNFVIIQNEKGFLVLKKVSEDLVITILANSNINMGMLLSASKKITESLI